MILKKIYAPVFFILSFVFALLSMGYSGAINQGKLVRETIARVAADEDGLLKLDGLDNNIYNVNNKDIIIGSITNHSGQKIELTVTLVTEYLWINNKNSWYRIKIGDKVSDFHYKNELEKQVTLILEPGQKVDVRGSMQNNLHAFASTSFYFTAKDTAGTYTMQFGDSIDSPRRVICY
ncbi:MAG: hypothetical protein K0S47_1277 [Herbinix sp.]|jgi:hypothetical protein|nr:hypothetical protein [Herbinix sp.]